ncbi:MAG TPA: phosphatase domain-containing protein [Verrucomicrobiae bacterium]
MFTVRTILFLLGFMAGALASDLKPDEQVVFFPTLGWRVTNGWEAEIHGWVFEPERRPIMQALFRTAVGLDEGEWHESEKTLFQERAAFFLGDNERRKRFSILLGGLARELRTSEPNGHFKTRLHLNDSELTAALSTNSNHWLSFELLRLGPDQRSFPGSVQLLEENGLSVISDIDDTIKISQVLETRELLRNTFCRPFQPVPGMAAVYQSWAKSANAKFHYVTASPWQLYVPLSRFVTSNGFPAGTFHMKQFRLKDGTFLKLFASPEEYKLGVIDPMLERFPKRRFVLVGDSGERDPEVYGAVARRHPEQVVKILIRDVTREKAEAERYRKAFQGLPRELWLIFKEPGEIGLAIHGELRPPKR